MKEEPVIFDDMRQIDEMNDIHDSSLRRIINDEIERSIDVPLSVRRPTEAGGGAEIKNIPPMHRARILAFADRYQTDVTVVGSRARLAGKAQTPTNDYIFSKPPAHLRRELKQNCLREGPEMRTLDQERGGAGKTILTSS